ncbi:ATP-binding protein [Spirochaetota bacterium]
MLKDINKKIQMIDIQSSRIDKLASEKNNVKEEIEDLNDSLKFNEKKKKIFVKIKENLSRIERLNVDLKKVGEDVKIEKDKVRSISRLKNELLKSYPQFTGLGLTNNDDLDELQSLFINVRNLDESINDYSFKLGKRKRIFRKVCLGINVACITAILFVLAINDFSFKKDLFLLGGILGFAVIFTPIISVISHFTSKNKKTEELNKEKETSIEKMTLILSKNSTEINDFKLSDIYEFLLQYFEDYVEYTEKKKELFELEKTVKDSDHLGSIEAKLETFIKEENNIRSEIQRDIDSLFNNDFKLEEDELTDMIFEIDKDIEYKREEIKIKEKILLQIDNDMKQDIGASDEKDNLIEERENLGENLDKLNSHKGSLKFILEALKEAVDKREKKQLNKLLKSSLEKFNYITDNQFITVIDERVIETLITKNKVTEDLNPTMIHHLLLSIKLSLTDFLIDGDYSLPIIIDDPFLFMDDDRIYRFKKVVFDISKKRQVIILTHTKDKKNWGKYIEL